MAATAAALLLTTALPEAAAKPPTQQLTTVDVKNGKTSLVLDETFAGALTEAGAAAAKIIPGQFVKGQATYRFPITGGAFDLQTLQGEFIHSGGILVTTDAITVSLTDFIVTHVAPAEEPTEPVEEPIEPAPVSNLSALVTVNGTLVGRIALFQIDSTAAGLAKPHALAKNKKVPLNNLALTLTAEGAEALNSAFDLTAFTEGDAVGSVSVLLTSAKDGL